MLIQHEPKPPAIQPAARKSVAEQKIRRRQFVSHTLVFPDLVLPTGGPGNSGCEKRGDGDPKIPADVRKSPKNERIHHQFDAKRMK